jgi:type IV secretion system protein VirB8
MFWKTREKGAEAPQGKLTPEQQYFQEATAWENDRVQRASKSERRAWIVAGAASLIAVCAVVAVAGLTPLKTTEPFVVRVDSSTGIVDVISALKEDKTNYDEAVNKYFLSKYVMAREHWLFSTYKEDYQTVGLLSDSQEQKSYAVYMNPRNNPKSPLNVFGEAAEVKVQIKNISFINDGVAMVRYIKTVERSGERERPTHWVATVPFTYVSAPMKEKDRLVNPLGFQVVGGYRNDPETVMEGLL